MKQSLYNIVEEQRYTLSEIEDMGGELTPELEEQLVINAHQLESKSIAYLEVIKDREAYINNAKEEKAFGLSVTQIVVSIGLALSHGLLEIVFLFMEA